MSRINPAQCLLLGLVLMSSRYSSAQCPNYEDFWDEVPLWNDTISVLDLVATLNLIPGWALSIGDSLEPISPVRLSETELGSGNLGGDIRFTIRHRGNACTSTRIMAASSSGQVYEWETIQHNDFVFDTTFRFEPDRVGDAFFELRLENMDGELIEMGFLVIGIIAQVAPILDPYDAVTNQSPITLTGTAMGSQVEVAGPFGRLQVPVTANRFQADVPMAANHKNKLSLTALIDNHRGLSQPITIIHDARPPELIIQFPENGASIMTPTVDVGGLVGDPLSGFMGLRVMVNGLPASVAVGLGTNGSFWMPNLLLNPAGPTTITVTATDSLGNAATRTLTVQRTHIPAGTPRLIMVSGNRQSGPVNAMLPEPVEVAVLLPDGDPFANKWVDFRIIRGDGQVGNGAVGEGEMFLQSRTDASGHARAYWRLGSDAGFGNHRLKVTSRDVAGSLLFCASATAGPPSQINIGSGQNQRAEAGGPAAEPLVVWVNDGCNGLSGMPVQFRAVIGGGKVNGQNQVTVMSDRTGHASVNYWLGPEVGNQWVTADFPDNPGSEAVFNIQAMTRDETMPTRLSGLVVDNSLGKIRNATIHLTVGGQNLPVTTTDENGRFFFSGIPGGPALLEVNGAVADGLNGNPIPMGSFPSLSFDLNIIPNAENSLPMPVKLPRLNPANEVFFDNTVDQVLTVGGIEGLRMLVRAGSMTRADGTVPSPADPAVLSLNAVHADDIPMPMPDGAAPPFAWTLQPAGARFDPPIEIVYPNMSGLAPGSVAYFLSFNHDTHAFEIAATGHVTEDGAAIVSDPGTGLSVSGWGCNCPPYSVTADCKGCPLLPNGCEYPRPPNFPLDVIPILCNGNLITVDFRPACNLLDLCWGDCSNGQTTNKDVCVSQFLQELNGICSALISCPEAEVFCGIVANLYNAYFVLGRNGCNIYRQIQRRACWCEDMGNWTKDRASLSLRDGPDVSLLSQLGYLDEDGDLLPDDWEIQNGLNSMNAFDALEDSDEDGLINAVEFMFGTHPMWPATFGVDDLSYARSFQPPPPPVLDPSWIVTVNGQTVQAEDMGFFYLANISAADLFGPGGPGTTPDFLSDDFVRVVAVSTVNGVTRYAFGEPFQLAQGETFHVSGLTFTETPPPLPESITLTTPTQVMTFIGQTTQLQVTATLSDGGNQDVTPRAAWTVYRTSNPKVVAVDGDGLITAAGEGTAFITAVNDGAAAVTRIDVSPDNLLTSVEGFLQFETGDFVSDGKVAIPFFGRQAISYQDGRFAFTEIPVLTGEPLTVMARRYTQVQLLAFSSNEPVPEGITDAGLLTLQTIDFTDSDGDGVPDTIETLAGSDPNDSGDDAGDDADGDGLPRFGEYLLGFDPANPDTDGNGVRDGEQDSDFDGLTDFAEIFNQRTDPDRRDTDGDGFNDGDEFEDGSDPLDPLSIPNAVQVGPVPAVSVSLRNRDLPDSPSQAAGTVVSLNSAASPDAIVGRTESFTLTLENIALTKRYMPHLFKGGSDENEN